MAINPETQYPGKIAPSTPAYPYGAARNITVPGDGTGTPWEAAIVNDLLGMQQSFLSATGLVPSGTPDQVGASQYLESVYKLTGLVNNKTLGGAEDTGPLNVAGAAVRIIPQPVGVDNTVALIDDAQHDPINSTAVSIGLVSIEVDHEQPLGSQVVGSMLAAPDEEMVKLGLQIGGSIAANKSVFFFSKPHTFIMDWENLAVIDPFMDVAQRYGVTDNTTHITVLHPTSYSGTRGITPIDDTGPDATYIFFTGINTDFYPYKNDVTLQVLFNGVSYELHHANPVIDAALATLGFSVAEAAGVFTITHPAARRDNANPTSSAGETLTADYYSTWARPDSVSPKTKTVAVCPDLDNAGATHTFVNGEYFYVTLREVLWKFGKSAIDLGMVQVSPTLDFKDTPAGNNFWLLGNHWPTK